MTAPLTPTQDLVVEVLIARYRLGETLWTFESRHRRTAEQLDALGIVTWKHGIVENTIMVWFTPAGSTQYLAYPYRAPILDEAQSLRAELDQARATIRALVSPALACPA